MLKIITWVITKIEHKLSKKYKCVSKFETIHADLLLYRQLLNEIDKYNYQTKGITTIRHYRYKTFKVD